MFRYIGSSKECRSNILLRYFGEEPPGNCNKCDVCLGNSAVLIRSALQKEIMKLLVDGKQNVHQIVLQLGGYKEKDILNQIRLMVDEHLLVSDGAEYTLRIEQNNT